MLEIYINIYRNLGTQPWELGKFLYFLHSHTLKLQELEGNGYFCVTLQQGTFGEKKSSSNQVKNYNVNSSELTGANFYLILFDIETEILHLLSTKYHMYLNNSNNYTTTEGKY